jgi:hypothetical protein
MKVDIGDHSGRFVVKRDLILSGHLNRDVGNLCGWSNFGNKSCVLCLLHLFSNI